MRPNSFGVDLMFLRRWIGALAALLAGAGVVASANAHDLWLQPANFRIAADGAVPMTVFVGHGADRQRWGVAIDRVVRLRSLSASGVVDQRPTLLPASFSQDFPIPLNGAGVHILMMESAHASSILPALRFNDYLKQEGLTPAIAARARARSQNLPGREIYSRRAKVLVQVGQASGRQPHLTQPVGLSLEIVPERNPFDVRKGETLPVRVLYEGRPLRGALVKMTNLDDDKTPVERHLTDGEGRASFRARAGGKWLLNVVWTKPLTGYPGADFDTTFSSLTFSFAG